jgi:lysocardiolipin and lysophospholipid acyltransferase
VILITVLFAPTSLVFTTDIPNLVERDHGEMIRLNLPDQLILIANHQAYTDWILLKAALKNIPVIGWGMVSPHRQTLC